MRHRFNIADMLQSVVGSKGLPFPMGAISTPEHDKSYTGDDNFTIPDNETTDEYTKSGEVLYKKDMLGRWYFMPVSFSHDDFEFEIDCALVSINRSKRIVKTDLVSQRGSVKELISIKDYEITIKGTVVGFDKRWPEDKLTQLDELWEINKAIDIHCALTSVFLKPLTKVVLTDNPILETKDTEHVQLIEIKCITDNPFELILD